MPCIADCNGNGRCIGGQCECYPGFRGSLARKRLVTACTAPAVEADCAPAKMDGRVQSAIFEAVRSTAMPLTARGFASMALVRAKQAILAMFANTPFAPTYVLARASATVPPGDARASPDIPAM